MFTYLADAALFRDCDSGDGYPVAMEGGYLELERAYLATRREPGEAVLATLQGSIVQRPPMEGDGTVATLVVDRFLGIWPGETCGDHGTTVPLQDMMWKVVRLRGRSVTVAEGQREPHLVLHTEDGRLSGSGGCNRLMGTYEVRGDTLQFGAVATTMMACPEGMEQEQRLLEALAEVVTFRLEGVHLELYAADGEPLLRLEERAVP
jgi:copper homeostasis protein (lipoprotein)